MKNRRYYRLFSFIAVLCALLLLLSPACYGKSGTETSGKDGQSADLTMTFLDVGQGTAVVAQSDGHAMIYDGGPAKSSSFVVSWLKKQGIKQLDYVIASHYDADHISGLVGVLNVFDVDTVLNPDYEADTDIYQSYEDSLAANGCEVTVPEVGDVYDLGTSSFTVVSPVEYDYDSENNLSLGLRLTCGDNSFLMLGDAQAESEYDMLDDGEDLSADVYLVSHHGSSYSTSERLLDAMNASSYVISAERDNSYGHPAEDLMERLQDRGGDLYRTDLQGTITAVSDGKTITFTPEATDDWRSGEEIAKDDGAGTDKKDGAKVAKAQKGDKKETTAAPETDAGEQYIGNKNSKKFHLPSCRSLPEEKNRVYFDSRQEAIDAGYVPCKNCDP